MYTKNNIRHDIRNAQSPFRPNTADRWDERRNTHNEKPIPPSNYGGTLYISDGYTGTPYDKRERNISTSENITPKTSVQTEYPYDTKYKRSVGTNVKSNSTNANTESKKDTGNMNNNSSTQKRKKNYNINKIPSDSKIFSPNRCDEKISSETHEEFGRGGFPKIDWHGQKGYFRKQDRCHSTFSQNKISNINDYTVGAESANIFENISLAPDDIILAALIIMLLSSKSSGESTDDILVLILTVLLMSGLSKQNI